MEHSDHVKEKLTCLQGQIRLPVKGTFELRTEGKVGVNVCVEAKAFLKEQGSEGVWHIGRKKKGQRDWGKGMAQHGT